MAGSYKTPNVYVEEITKFPPSVAEVDTAIPAFIGYTEIAKRYVDDDLINVPTRIESLLDYVQYFGGGPAYSDISVVLMTTSNIVESVNSGVANSIYSLYESMQLFFDNGGGVCYICSAGKYNANDTVANRATNITNALAKVRLYDEPTILLFPDGVKLYDSTNAGSLDLIASLQQAALKQCADLGDRFAVLDIPEINGNTTLENADSFRSKIGINNLKYGGAYMPFIKTTYIKTFRLRDIMMNLYRTSVNVANKIALKSLFSASDKDANGMPIPNKLDDFTKLYTDNIAINNGLVAFNGIAQGATFSAADLDNKYYGYFNNFRGAADDGGRKSAIKSAIELIYMAYAQLEGLTTAHATNTDSNLANLSYDTDLNAAPITPIRVPVIANTTLNGAVNSFLTTNTNLKTNLQTLANLNDEAYVDAGHVISNAAADVPRIDFSMFSAGIWALGAATVVPLITPLPPADANYINAVGAMVFNIINPLYEAVKAGIVTAISIGTATETTAEQALIPDLPIYNSIEQVLNTKTNTLPPSGAIAGIYASVDRDRGVWKAPANVSINSVSDVSELIDDSTQDGLNVDANAGKSINAIRAFYGKGILVWGARTLAGNDNEWRYVPVRRFFSFVEESCKKSTSWCVFEPNDANTWARIRGQIDNFLNNQWRLGALAGAKPEQAYYINCGLGITMTAQDILNGYLYVEIGMAAVRPAEFVVLRFSHMLQQS